MTTNLVTLLMVGALGGIASGLAQTKTSPPAAAETVARPETSGPRIEFGGTAFNFGKTNAGEVVRHDFVFTNTGTATLEITDVRPGCGCTTAGGWDRRVEPGKTGAIPLQFNSTGFGGSVTKSATVICNDPGKSNVVLQITGIVWRPIEVTPSMTVFNVSSERQTNETKVVRIVSNLEEPLELSDLQCTNRSFQAELKTVRPGKEFELHITAVPPFTAGHNISSPVSLKTSSSRMPAINLTAYVMVQPPVTVAPEQINLPSGPLAAAMSLAVAIRNNGTNSLGLSDASVNFPGAEVLVKETQPGRLFSLMVNLPAGFQIKPDQKVEVSVKSTHPKMPLIKVPVSHRPPPAAPVASQSSSSSVQLIPAKEASPAPAGK